MGGDVSHLVFRFSMYVVISLFIGGVGVGVFVGDVWGVGVDGNVFGMNVGV